MKRYIINNLATGEVHETDSPKKAYNIMAWRWIDYNFFIYHRAEGVYKVGDFHKLKAFVSTPTKDIFELLK